MQAFGRHHRKLADLLMGEAIREKTERDTMKNKDWQEYIWWKKLLVRVKAQMTTMRRKKWCAEVWREGVRGTHWLESALENKQKEVAATKINKDLQELKEMEVMKAKIDIVRDLSKNQNKQEDAMKLSDMLGVEYRDKIGGFKGVCTGVVEYISGCNQALLIPRMGKDGKSPDGAWYDVQRLERVGKKIIIIKLDNVETPGCDMPAPIR